MNPLTEWMNEKNRKASITLKKATLNRTDKARAKPHAVAQCLHIYKEAIGRGTGGS